MYSIWNLIPWINLCCNVWPSIRYAISPLSILFLWSLFFVSEVKTMYLCDKFQSHLRICRNNCFLSMLLNKLGKKMPQAQNLVSVFFIYNQDATDSQLIMNCDPVELQY